MKIIILGAGQVGGTLAENLVNEDNDITVIDNDQERLSLLQDKFDLRTITGNAASPRILREAGAADADMLVAVTSSDETNMISCQIAYTLFGTPTKIARIRSSDYIKESDKLFTTDTIPINHIISPEKLVISDIAHLIDYPGALQVAHFADDNISIVTVKTYYGGPLVGYSISTLRETMPHLHTRIVSVIRQDRFIRARSSTIIEAGDEITFVCETQHIRAVMSQLQRLEKPYKRIMIVGGGNIGAGLAQYLQSNHRVKLIERNPQRAEKLAETLDKVLVFSGDSSDQSLLYQEHIENIDAFIALTSDDEANIMSALLAKRLGAQKAMVLIQRIAYLNLIQGGTIDIAVSPQQATISALLSHVRRGDIVNVASMRQGEAEAIEVIAHGDRTTSSVIDRKIVDIKLPYGCSIGAIYRRGQVLIARRNLTIEEGDHVIFYLHDKKHVPDIEKLFQPTAFFI